ncbi:MAG: GNAT family N-acetyltransferase [Crocinitomicaceae bacterium]|nr:GNAT family N-acetyltransferase [Crocinitomicaceae bacterium]|tara:strand:- start:10019 stop:10522 length:504 start_codon:yes stop_codon:yes gene_type:complete
MECKLRPWKSTDLKSLVKYANNWKIGKNMTDKFPYPYTEEAGKKFIEYASGGEPLCIFAIEIRGEACGGIGVHPQEDIHKKNMELGYWLAEPLWGHGIVSKAIKEMVEYGFNTFPINRIFARPYGSNKASQRVLEKNGFVLEARLKNTIWKKDRFEDELIYAVRLDE